MESGENSFSPRRRISQIAQKQRGILQVADLAQTERLTADKVAKNAKQPFFRVAGGVCENGNDAIHDQMQSFRF